MVENPAKIVPGYGTPKITGIEEHRLARNISKTQFEPLVGYHTNQLVLDNI